jgi:hypothetical protein
VASAQNQPMTTGCCVLRMESNIQLEVLQTGQPKMARKLWQMDVDSSLRMLVRCEDK